MGYIQENRWSADRVSTAKTGSLSPLSRLEQFDVLPLVPKLTCLADAATRRDHSLGLIDDERAYVATLLARTRDLWSLLGGSSQYVAFQPSTVAERKYGIDGILLIHAFDCFKVVAFEAKRPGFGLPRNWDATLYPPHPHLSRFNRQLESQKAIQLDGWVTGGLFINELPPGEPGIATADKLGSTFIEWRILHPYSANVVATFPHKWKTSDLAALMLTPGVQALGLEDLLTRVVNCEDGTPMDRGRLLQSARTFNAAAKAARARIESPQRDEPEPERNGEEDESDSIPALLRALCRNTGAGFALMLDVRDSTDLLRSRWREKQLDAALSPPSKTERPTGERF